MPLGPKRGPSRRPISRRLLRLYPELNAFPTDDHRRAAARDMRQGRRFGVEALKAFLILLVASTLWAFIGRGAISLGYPIIAECGKGLTVMLAVWCVLSYQAGGRRDTHDFLRQRLNELGIPTCQACGYDLRGLSEVRCPECGAVPPPAKRVESADGTLSPELAAYYRSVLRREKSLD